MKLLFIIFFLAFTACSSKNEELSADPDASKLETGTTTGTSDVGAGEPPKAGTGKPLQQSTGQPGKVETLDPAGVGADTGVLGGRSGPPPIGRLRVLSGAGTGKGPTSVVGGEIQGPPLLPDKPDTGGPSPVVGTETQGLPLPPDGADTGDPSPAVGAEIQGSSLPDGVADAADKKLVCNFSNSLKKAVEDHLKMKCAVITREHLAGIKELRIKYIFEEELPLLNKEYTAYFTGLEKLDISKNLYMNHLPSFVIHLPQLKELNISQTGISDFSKDICELKNLTTLLASHNNYKGQEVPMNTFCLSQLKVLDMSYSSIRYIDEYISKLENLEELHMRNNELMTLPFMQRLLPKLLLVDLRGNVFVPWNLEEDTTGADNILYDCKKYSDSEEREECQEEMQASFECNWIEKIPFQRGLPFRQYKALEDMTSAERETFEKSKPQPSKNRCYSFWFNNTFRLLPEEEKKALQEKTINGKTIREWRLVYSEREKYSIWRKYGFSVCEQIIVYSDTVHLPDSQEVFPERHYSPNWTTPPKEECVMKSEEKND